MGMRFRKSIGIGKGAKINLSKSGIGASVGGKGMRYSVHSSGRRTTSAGIPGSGLYYVSTSSTKSKSNVPSLKTDPGMTEAAQRRLIERFQKKVALADERMKKPLLKLKELYVAGKIDKPTYENLSKRNDEVTIDLIIFGMSPGLKLAERYVMGKIDKSDFDKIKIELIGEQEAEKQRLDDEYIKRVTDVDEYTDEANKNISDSNCNYCEKEKKLFRPLFKEDDFKLCMACRGVFRKLKNVPGRKGIYYYSFDSEIEPKTKNELQLHIYPKYILEYR